MRLELHMCAVGYGCITLCNTCVCVTEDVFIQMVLYVSCAVCDLVYHLLFNRELGMVH